MAKSGTMAAHLSLLKRWPVEPEGIRNHRPRCAGTWGLPALGVQTRLMNLYSERSAEGFHGITYCQGLGQPPRVGLMQPVARVIRSSLSISSLLGLGGFDEMNMAWDVSHVNGKYHTAQKNKLGA